MILFMVIVVSGVNLVVWYSGWLILVDMSYMWCVFWCCVCVMIVVSSCVVRLWWWYVFVVLMWLMMILCGDVKL